MKLAMSTFIKDLRIPINIKEERKLQLLSFIHLNFEESLNVKVVRFSINYFRTENVLFLLLNFKGIFIDNQGKRILPVLK